MVLHPTVDPQHTPNLAEGYVPPAISATVEQHTDNAQEHTSNAWQYRETRRASDSDDNDLLSEDDSQYSFLHQTRSQISPEILLSTMLPHVVPAADTIGGAEAATSVDRMELARLLALLKTPTGTMPIPSSEHAPRFRGNNLRTFLNDYNMAAENVGWTGQQKCEHIHLYCSPRYSNLVRKLAPCKAGNWSRTVQELYRLFQGEEKPDRYSRESIDRFVSRDRSITKRKDVVKYYREFSRRLQGLRDELPNAERDRLFWKGIPEDVQRDAYYELRAKKDAFSRHKAPDMHEVYKLILAVMDKDSLYANLANSWNPTKTKHDRKHLKKRNTSDTDSESDSFYEAKPKHRRKSGGHGHDLTSDSDDLPSSDDPSDSDSTEDERSHQAPKKKASRSSNRRAKKRGSGTTTTKNDIAEVTRAFERLQLMLTQAPSRPTEEKDIPRANLADRKFSNADIMQVMSRMAQEIQDNRNDMNLLLDQQRNAPPPNQPTFGRCFFCKQSNVHPRGSTNCPDAQAVVNEGLCIFRDGRIYMTDNSEPPRGSPNESMASAIRRLVRTRNNPPQQNRTPPARTPQVTFAEIVGPADDESDTETASHIGSTNAALWQNVFAADRASPVKNARYNPISKENRHVHWKDGKPDRTHSPKPQPYVDLPPVPKQWGASNHQRPAVSAPSEPAVESQPIASTSAPQPGAQSTPVHILKRPDTAQSTNSSAHPSKKQKESVARSSVKKPDFVLRGDPRVPFPGPEKVLPRNPARSKATTNMRSKYDDQSVYQQVLQTEVALPLGAILALSPGLEKKISADTKLHNVPITQVSSKDLDEDAMDVLAGFAQDVGIKTHPDAYDDAPATPIPSRAFASETTSDLPTSDHYNNVANAYSAHRERHVTIPESKLTAPTGAVIIRIGDQENIAAMIDSGAEMNLVTPELAAKLENRFAIDDAGKQYSMKNVSGDISRLDGCFNNIPVELGGKRWDATFFIGDSWFSEFHLILGQPFLRRYACSMNWSTIDGVDRMSLRLYPEGQREKPPVTALMFDTNAPKQRNMPALVGWIGVDQPPNDEYEITNPFINPEPFIQEFDPPSDNMTDNSSQSSLEETLSDIPLPDEGNEVNLQWSDREAYASASSDESSDNNVGLDVFTSTADNTTRVARIEDLERAFHDATTDYRNSVQPDREQISMERAHEIYRQRFYRALYRIPFGNRMLMIGEGEHNITINSQPFRMFLEPRARFNAITSETLRRAGLHQMTSQEDQATPMPACVSHNGLAYCKYVPINLGTRPILPGIFHITDDDLPGGYDLICGKPWMIGLQIYFSRSLFDPSSEPGTPWLEDSNNSNGSPSVPYSPSILNDALANIIPSYHYSHVMSTHTNLTHPRTEYSAVRYERPPDRGGTFTRSL